jgi:hypothetical protein
MEQAMMTVARGFVMLAEELHYSLQTEDSDEWTTESHQRFRLTEARPYIRF